MKLGVLTVLFYDRSFEETLKYLNAKGIQAVEVGCGGFPGNDHCNAEELLSDNKKLEQFKDTLKKYDMTLSALSVHGNAVHPNKEIADKANREFETAVLLAEKLGVDRIVTFSGCPGDCDESKNPNWVTCPWPESFLEVLDWQWNEKLIPYWKKAGAFAKNHGVDKIALEMHPGFCVYNPETLLKLRAAVGDVIGANFDPSHLFWQGIDPVLAIRELKGAIYHFHAKDTYINELNVAKNGVLDTKHFSEEASRSWIFRTVGYGHGEQLWKDICSELRLCGYDYVMSIEHEDSFMTSTEGLSKAIEFLNRVMIFEEKPTGMWWA